MENLALENIFKSSYNFNDWKSLIKTLFPNSNTYQTHIESIDKTINYHQIAKSIQEFGKVDLADGKVLKFYDIELEPSKHVTKNRVGLRNLIHNEVIPGDVDAILVVFHTPGDKDWRLTFISKSVFWDDDYNENKQETSARRYTYVLGEDESVKTAVEQFEKIKGEKVTVKHLIELFNVEKISKRFFDEYKKQYEKFNLFLTGEKFIKKGGKYILKKIHEPSPLLKEQFSNNTKKARDFTKKLLGRVVFLHFLQKKGWMGCTPHPTEWENGEKQFLLKLLEGFEDKKHFHSKCLTTLFFNTLNAKRDDDVFKVKGLNNHINKTKVPYLNGGLFETDKGINAKKIDFPIDYFEELLDFFGQYNFTIDENSPDDHEVGIDPEMLGHIFENLLEDNKDKGAFYTPKEIVQYMTQESLIQYLQTHLGEHYEIENFIRNHDKGDEQAKENFIRENAQKIEELLDKVKVCDPAIGSGAFPMGMLNEIFKAKMALDWTLDRSKVKKSIIQNSIYGVDLESGAVDIARLRFWLALVVDEKNPQALPNLDYKIMQGNSLLESFEGIDLSKIHKGKTIEIDKEKSKANLFSQELKKKENVEEQEKLEDLINTFFETDDPEEKRILRNKIDQQVLNNIYFTLNDHKEELDKDYKKQIRKIKNKSASLRSADQKIKYENESKDAKAAKKLNIKLEDIANKQLKLKELYQSNERPFFLWHLMFKEVFDQGGFDIVIGNPPYVKIQNIDNNLSEIYKEKYLSAKGKYDLYILFIESAFSLIKQNGSIVFINPHRFIVVDYGSKLREIISKRGWLSKLVYFGVEQIFENATTYSGIFHFKENSKYVSYVEPTNKNLVKLNYTKIPYTLLNDKWLLTNNKNTLKVISTINNYSQLSNFCEGIYQGIITTGDKIFMLKGHINGDVFYGYSDALEKDVELESEALKPILKGGDIKRYETLKTNRYVIFLHEEINEKTEPISEESFIKFYPKTYKYLLNFKNHLIDKKVKYKTNSTYWYSLHRSRELNILTNENKIITPQLQNESSFTIDFSGNFIPDAGGYIVSPKDEYSYLYKSILGILNSKLFYFFITKTSTPYNNNYYYFKTNYIFPFKIPEIIISSFRIFDYIFNYIKFIMIFDKKNSYKNIQLELEDIIDALVFELYFPEDFKKAGIEILKYAEQEFIDIEGLPEERQKEIILSTYTRLSEKKNPLRNQMKLMKIELKELLNPILSI